MIKEIIKNKPDINIATNCLSIKLGKNPPPLGPGVINTKIIESGTQTRINLNHVLKISSLRKYVMRENRKINGKINRKPARSL